MKPNTAHPARPAESDEIEEAFRPFDGPEWTIKHTLSHGRPTEIVVSVVGLEYPDGHALREIIIDCPDSPIFTPAEARKLATALRAAADSAEG